MLLWLGCSLYAELDKGDFVDTGAIDSASAGLEDDQEDRADDPTEESCAEWAGGVSLAGEQAVDVTVGPDRPIYEVVLEGDGWVCGVTCDDPRLFPAVLADLDMQPLPVEADGLLFQVKVETSGRTEEFAGSCSVEVSDQAAPLYVELTYELSGADTGAPGGGTDTDGDVDEG